MHVEQIILEGFKTYMNRTVISGFDPQFNAITGLNGSGKSNILDAIQFLLGSTSKQFLRLKAGLTQLIYKQGFAGIEKASVTIKFRCHDRLLRPTGYQNCQELVITRQITKDKVSKFFVNGVSSNLGKVRNLFRSVQLNIENPHFLVKQGQITKIIHLKPLELLGILQQTAGTAYYNKTKIQSQKLIQKKQQKLKAINDILAQSIQPQMQKLDADRRRYIAFKDKQSLMAHMNHKLKTHQFSIKMRQVKQKEEDHNGQLQILDMRKQQIRINVRRLGELEMQQKELSAKGDSPLQQYQQVKKKLAEKQNQRNSLRNRIQKLHKDAVMTKQQSATIQQQIQKNKQERQWQQKAQLQHQREKEEIEEMLEQFGKNGGEKEAGEMTQKLLMQEEARTKNIVVEIKVVMDKKKAVLGEIQNQKKIAREAQENKQGLSKNLQEIQIEIKGLQSMKEPASIQDPQLISGSLRQLQNTKKRLLTNFHALNFHYQSPGPQFDRSKVKGKVFQLFRAKQKIHQKALQIGAAGKLFNIVVQNQIVSKLLIQKQSFGRNVTMIPNNKIQFKRINPDALAHAQKVAKQLGGVARPAYQLISFNPQIDNSIMFVFSNFIVCSTSQIAQRIAHNRDNRLSVKCVTYQGDIMEKGTLSGGFSNQQSMILPQYAQLASVEEKIKKQREMVDQQKVKYEQYQKAMIAFRDKQKDLDYKQNKREKMKMKLMNMELQVKKRDFQKEIADIDNKLKDLQKEKGDHAAKAEKLRSQLQNKKVKSIAQQRKQLQKQLAKAGSKLSQTKKKISALQVHMQQLKVSIKHQGVLGDDLQKQILQLQKKQRDINGQLRQFQIAFESLQQQKRKYQKEAMINQAKYKAIHSQFAQLKASQDKLQQQIATLQKKISNTAKQIEQNTNFIEELLDTCAWLSRDQQYPVDPAFNYQEMLKQYKGVQGQVQKLKRSAKMNIDDHSYQKLNQQYKNLLEKRSTLQQDKVTLLTNMHDLDQKRTKTLQKCFESVKINLTKIFSDLLPGATAHLHLIDQRDVTKGAQLSVHFNSVRKQLGQLSGGQRSLLALSFILSLLLYKPSPFYILDEIDSALDLSHTENIGYMISQRFPQSQFILISLKEGMFQNANVLFKVHFAEGESKVQRNVLKNAIKRH